MKPIPPIQSKQKPKMKEFPPPQLTYMDAEILRGFTIGDNLVIDTTFSEFKSIAFLRTLKKYSTKNWCDDVFSIAWLGFLRVFEKHKQFEINNSGSNYLLRYFIGILKNKIKDQLIKDKNSLFDQKEVSETTPIDDPAFSPEMVEFVKEAISRLSDKCKYIVGRKYYDNWNWDQIAIEWNELHSDNATNKSLNMAWGRNCRKELQKLLQSDL